MLWYHANDTKLAIEVRSIQCVTCYDIYFAIILWHDSLFSDDGPYSNHLSTSHPCQSVVPPMQGRSQRPWFLCIMFGTEWFNSRKVVVHVNQQYISSDHSPFDDSIIIIYGIHQPTEITRDSIITVILNSFCSFKTAITVLTIYQRWNCRTGWGLNSPVHVFRR